MEWEGRKKSEQLPEDFPHFFDGVETVADLIFFLGGHLGEGFAAWFGDFLPRELFEFFFDETVRHYPDPELLAHTYNVYFRNRNPVVRLGRALEYATRAKTRRWNSRYQMALMIRERLARLHGQAPPSA